MELIYLLVTLVSLCSTISSKYIDLRVKCNSSQLCPLKCKLFFFFFFFFFFLNFSFFFFFLFFIILCYVILFYLFILFIYLLKKIKNKKLYN